ncbi:MAG TPA: hypothetical protein VKE88_03260 [Candidatus Nanoarchaeia archaeon]|nr:hypothetical protein [Candidatus Nanoarchaeia archaeon]
MKNKNMNNATHWAFLIGAVVSLLVGIGAFTTAAWATNNWIPVVLVVLGLAVGFANVSAKETTPFLVAAIALLAFGSGGLNSLDTLLRGLGTFAGATVQAFSFFVGAAAIVVAVKEAWALANN